MSDQRDIYEVANQLGGYVGPTTPEFLKKFLLRESEEASKLADRIIHLEKALRDIAEERGRCSKCGKLADMPSNCVSCDNYRACTWAPQNPADIARAALDAKERKE